MSKIPHVSESQFQSTVVQSDTPVLVDFSAHWCGPCQLLAPHLEKLADHYGDRLRIVQVDVDREPALAGKFQVRGVPTLLLFDGGKPVDQIVGLIPPNQLAQRIDRVAKPTLAG